MLLIVLVHAGSNQEIGPSCPSTNDETQQPQLLHHQHPPQRCTLFLAESSIPNAGLGIYSGISVDANSTLPYLDVVIPIHDIELHNNYNAIIWLLSDYTWTASKLGVDREAKRVKALTPGLGALANNHPTLKNIAFHGVSTDDDQEGYRRGTNPGVGSITPYYGVTHYATSSIEEGSELFHDYGALWGEKRFDKIGPMPLTEHYNQADKIIACFDIFLTNTSLSTHDTLAKNIWNDIRLVRTITNQSSTVIISRHVGLASEIIIRHLREMLSNGSCIVENVRTEAALSFPYSSIKYAMSVGSARAYLPHFTRSISWLDENGRCIDGLAVAPSSFGEFGRGAFATRKFATGDVITTTPLLQLNRTLLDTYQFSMNHPGKQRKLSPTKLGRQLLLNYCYGHRDSSLVFFPYSPAVSMLNNGGKEMTNAQLKFSNFFWHKYDWESDSAEELLNKNTSGLIFDIITTKPISSGEEIFIDYGKEWEHAWQKHLDLWSPVGDERMQSIHKKTPYTSDIHLPQAFRSSIGISNEVFPEAWRDLS